MTFFKIMYHDEPERAYQMDMSAEDLAATTSEQAFKETDLNDDGNLTLGEFQKWYKDLPPHSRQAGCGGGPGARVGVAH